MGKLLRVLVVFLFILSGAVLTLGIMLFNRREVLKGRTQALERHVVALSQAYIEDEPAPDEQAAFTARDVDDVTPNVLDNPEVSTFWDTYQLHLEKQDLPRMNLRTQDRIRQMMTYYVRDNIETYMLLGTHVVKKDVYGMPRTKVEPGENYKPTLQNLLDDVLAKAGDQYTRLNNTRQQLKVVREELVRTIEDLNTRKRELRQALAEIVRLNNRIRDLENQIAQLQARIRALEEEVRAKEEKIEEQKRTIQERDEEIIELNAKIDAQDRKIKELLEIISLERPKDPTLDGIVFRLEPGVKGKVVEVNAEWNYVVMELSDESLAELAGLRGTEWPPPVEFLLKRPERDEFVTKVRLFQVKRGRKLALANILSDWQQIPVSVGDVVFF
jgi:hypothetical protein